MKKRLFLVAACMLVVVVFLVCLPVFVCDRFKIGGGSMNPALDDGDHVIVNKLLMGARIYTDYDFTSPEVKCFRMPGLRAIRPGDVAVFNSPRGRGREKIEFKINYVYVKRCIGCPGDTVGIRSGFYYNASSPGAIFGSVTMQETLGRCDDAMLEDMGVAVRAFPFDDRFGWSVRNFGPLYVPKKGRRIDLDEMNLVLYDRVIEYETGSLPYIADGIAYIGSDPVTRYEFQDNWYFFGGDNVLNSNDSRYAGFVPEDYIVGIVGCIL